MVTGVWGGFGLYPKIEKGEIGTQREQRSLRPQRRGGLGVALLAAQPRSRVFGSTKSTTAPKTASSGTRRCGDRSLGDVIRGLLTIHSTFFHLKVGTCRDG